MKSERMEKFLKHVSDTPSPTGESIKWRRENRDWLRRSVEIALKVLDALEEQKISQKQLAKTLGVSAQYVSKIVKGQGNLSLETISKLERALGIELIQIPANQTSVQTQISDGKVENVPLQSTTHFLIHYSFQPLNKPEVVDFKNSKSQVKRNKYYTVNSIPA
ncbi:MAG: helix-turn-helix domain-containing protein [Candidatus Kapaibacterium sp.]